MKRLVIAAIVVAMSGVAVDSADAGFGRRLQWLRQRRQQRTEQRSGCHGSSRMHHNTPGMRSIVVPQSQQPTRTLCPT